MTPVFALTRFDVAHYVDTLIWVYTILIFIRILLTWIPRMPYNRVLDTLVRYLSDVTDPFLNLFRRILPPARLGGAALDLSPIIALIVLRVVGSLIVSAIQG